MAFYLFNNAVSEKDCKEMLDYCLRNALWQEAGLVPEGEAAVIEPDAAYRKPPMGKDEKIRITDVSFITDKNDKVNEIIWNFIRIANEEFFHYKLSHFQPIQFSRYQDGGHYDWHQDDIIAEIPNSHGESRKLSLTFCLSNENDYDGGTLEFFNGDKEIIKNDRKLIDDIRKAGNAIVFDSSDWHRVTPITRGIRYSLVCWAVGPRYE